MNSYDYNPPFNSNLYYISQQRQNRSFIENSIKQNCKELNQQNLEMIQRINRLKQNSSKSGISNSTLSQTQINYPKSPFSNQSPKSYKLFESPQKTLEDTIYLLTGTLAKEQEQNENLLKHINKQKDGETIANLKKENLELKKTTIKAMKKLKKTQILYQKAVTLIKERDETINHLRIKNKLLHSNNLFDDTESNGQKQRGRESSESGSLYSEEEESAEAIIKELRERIDLLEEENELLREHHLEMTQQQIQNALGDLNDIKRDNIDLKQNIYAFEKLQNENQFLRHKIFTLGLDSPSKDSALLQQELNTVKSTCKTLQNRVDELQDENSAYRDIQKQVNDAIECELALERQFNDTIKALQNENEELKYKLQLRMKDDESD